VTVYAGKYNQIFFLLGIK